MKDGEGMCRQPLNGSRSRLDIESLCSPNRYSPYINPLLCTAGNDCACYVTCTNAKDCAHSLWTCTRETKAIDTAHLTTSTSGCFDEQWNHPRHTEASGGRCTHASGI